MVIQDYFYGWEGEGEKREEERGRKGRGKV